MTVPRARPSFITTIEDRRGRVTLGCTVPSFCFDPRYREWLRRFGRRTNQSLTVLDFRPVADVELGPLRTWSYVAVGATAPIVAVSTRLPCTWPGNFARKLFQGRNHLPASALRLIAYSNEFQFPCCDCYLA